MDWDARGQTQEGTFQGDRTGPDSDPEGPGPGKGDLGWALLQGTGSTAEEGTMRVAGCLGAGSHD